MHTIEILFSPSPNNIERYCVAIDEQTTLQAAIQASGLLNKHTNWDIHTLEAGIYGKKVPLETVLKPQNRIEIYRPLQIDPKAARRKRQ